MNDSTELSRAERLKLWQALKNAKKGAQNDTSSSCPTTAAAALKKRNRKKYIDRSQSLSGLACAYHDKPTKKNDKASTYPVVCENSDPNNDFEKAAASLHQKFRDVRLSDEFDQNSFTISSNSKSTGRRSSILDGYLTCNDSSPVPISHKKNSLTPPTESDNSSHIIQLQAKLDCMEKENEVLKLRVADANSVKREAVERLQMCVEETQAMAFHNDILTQKVEELESAQSMDRMNSHEVESQKSQKHKKEIKMLREKNQEYEKRANDMVAEMGEQMAALQDMAMKRIEQLESELMEEQHKNEALMGEVAKLRAAQSAADARYATRCRRAASVCSVEEDSEGTVGMGSDEENED